MMISSVVVGDRETGDRAKDSTDNGAIALASRGAVLWSNRSQ
jgi:hypothetical protein